MSSRWRDRLALHEAGHAVVSIVLHSPIAFVTVKQSAHYQGVAMPLPEATTVFNEAVVLMAGEAAELKQFGVVEGYRGDMDICRAVLGKCWDVSKTDPAVDRMIALLRDDARELVDKHWDWIIAVAAALKRQKRLTGDEVVALRPISASGNDRITPKGR